MMDNSRRDFFKSIIPITKKKKSNTGNQDVLTLGHLTAFPVHTITKIKLKQTDLIVESLPEGLRLRDEFANKNFKLSLRSNGLLQAHLNEVWPPSGVLSIFTGEISNI